MFSRLLVLIAMLFSCNSYAEPAANNRFLYLEGVITSNTLEPLTEALEKVIAGKGRAPVTIVINSPGGGVVAGMRFVNRMQTVRALDIDINCYVLDVAASMAFQILTQCTNRYALPNSFLLWHGVRMGTNEPITVARARSIAEDLQRMDDSVMRQLTSTLAIPEAEIVRHFNNETLWSGLGLAEADPNFLTLLDGYPQLLRKLNSAVQMGSGGFFFQIDQMIHIWPGYLIQQHPEVQQ